MSELVFLNYKNYYDRKFKSLSSVSAYKTADPSYFAISDINFDIADGVQTKQVVNFGANDVRHPFNYMIVHEKNSDTVKSRWYVMEDVFNRKNQSTFTLLRDVCVDFYDSYKNNDFFIERGNVSSDTDPLIYNNENQTFNQILQSRTSLVPSGASGRYVVGYVDKTWDGGIVTDSSVVGTYDKWEDCELYEFLIGHKKMQSEYATTYSLHLGIGYGSQPSTPGEPLSTTNYSATFSLLNPASHTVNALYNAPNLIGGLITSGNFNTLVNALGNNAGTSAVFESFTGVVNNYYDSLGIKPTNLVLRNKFAGKKINVGGTVYSISSALHYNEQVNVPKSTYFPEFLSLVKSLNSNILTNYNNTDELLSNLYLYFVYSYYTFSYSAVTPVITIGDDRPVSELPYDIFYVPDSAIARKFAGYFASQYAGGNVLYDIQLLPFKPSASNVTDTITIGGETATLTWASSDKVYGTFTHSSPVTYSTRIDRKVGSCCDMCRIVAPNGASHWDFNPATIGGVSANSIKYEVTFMPYNPYIHIFPTFSGIYGSINRDYNSPNVGESRGFVCTGDWSIPFSTSNWATYQLNNSAYMLSHDRQMENMSINQKLGIASDIVGGVANTIGMGITGGALGAGIGVAETIGNLFTGGIARKEQVSYAEDMFNYSLQNIKSQAQPLAHNNGITIGNSTFPILEYYSASTEEKNILKDRLRVNGFSINKISTFATEYARLDSSYCNFIRGKLIRTNIDDDSHIAFKIAEELEKGFYYV